MSARLLALPSQTLIRLGAVLLLSTSALPAGARDTDTQSMMSSELAGPALPTPPKSSVELTGDLRPKASADIAFKTGGQLLSVKVERGQTVKKGQVLAVLSDGEARAQLDQSAAAVTQTSAQLALAQDNEKRAATLVAANAAPDSQAVAVRLQTEIARGALLQAAAGRDLAGVNLANHQIKAPFDGVIVKVPDGTGQIVGAGVPLFRIETLDTLVLRTTVAEAELERVRVGAAVAIDTHGGQKVVGTVRLVLRSLDSSRRAPVEVDVPNPDGKLNAGGYVRAICAAH
jgi:RND family efflux transporter MFP subunit